MTVPRPTQALPIAGVDGCPDGWLCITNDLGTLALDANIYSTNELFAATRDHSVVAIDIPIGLTDSGARACDVKARQLLGPRRNSVFPAPVRATLHATSYLDACARSEAVHGKRLSQQAYAILPRIRDVDAALRADSSARQRVWEVHPEVCFTFWNGERPMPHAKRTPEGFRDRLVLVTPEFGEHAFDAVRRQFSRVRVADDDILDAFAALWTARRIHAGRAITVPPEPPVDREGLPMQMVG